MSKFKFVKMVENKKITQQGIFRFAQHCPQAALELASIWKDHEVPFYRSTAAFLYAKGNGFDVFKHLIKLSKDEDELVRYDALIAMGLSQDSRCFFPLAKILVNTSDSEERRKVILALSELGDPRILPYVEQGCFGRNEDLFIRKIRKDYRYRFNGSKDLLEAAEESEVNVLRDYQILEGLGKLIEQGNESYPNTYVVNLDRKFCVGNPRTEHVDVARGQDVLSAGEVVFLKTDSGLIVDYINNRSNGYYPAPHSYIHACTLDNIVLDLPENFTETFPREGFLDKEFLAQFEY